MRGDRPYRRRKIRQIPPAPPHARGSTLPHSRWSWLQSGSPACAGIDPRGTAGDSWAPGLPRMRGDRPDASNPDASIKEAPPHARGSTLKDKDA